MRIFLLVFCWSSLWLRLGGQNTHDNYYYYGSLKYEDHVYQPGIRTVQLHPAGQDLELPIIALNSGESLELSFDDLYEEFVNYTYTVYHCNADWSPSDLLRNDYLASFSEDYIQEFEYSANTLVPYTHYRLIFPNANLRLTKSGNYLLVVYRDDNPDNVVLSKRFMVYEDLVNVAAEVKRATKVQKINSHQEIDFTIFHSRHPIPNPYRDLQVVLMQNQRWDHSLRDLKPQFVQNEALVYQYDDENTFEGLNEFRFFDTKTLLALTQNVRRIDRDSLFRVYLKTDQERAIENYSVLFDINGMYRIRRQDMPNSAVNADYAVVDFILEDPSGSASKERWVFGRLSDWKLRDEFKMTWDENRNSYRLKVLLKQGYYNFLYAGYDVVEDAIDISSIEGSHWQTENHYQILVYNRDLGTRYDRLIGFGRFSSEALFNR